MQPLAIDAVHTPHISITPVFDPEGRFGRHEFEVNIHDENNASIAHAPLTMRLVRSDRPNGQVHAVQLKADRFGIARVVVNTATSEVELPEGQTTQLPAKTARLWTMQFESLDPVVTSNTTDLYRPRRSRGQ